MTGPVDTLRVALEDRYEIEGEIGRGGMATVYRARDLKHARAVALKVLDPDLGAVLGAERFLAEIRVTANLQHPNLLPLFDSGAAGGLLFYVMPFVEGETLRARLDREKQLPVDDAVQVAAAVASALAYAHAHGVIHRDLKPENILLQSGHPVIADFGIALAVSRAGGQRITQTGLSLGTPQYMSPEQATGDRTMDARTDIYSLGAVTYEMLTGEAPHTGATSQAVIAKLMTEAVRPITVLRRSVPAHVDAAVRRALEKLPADRFATAKEFGDAITGRYAMRADETPSAPAPGTAARAPRVRLLVSGAFAAGVVLTATAAWVGRGLFPETSATPTRFMLAPDSADGTLADGTGQAFAVSPDGRRIAMAVTKGQGASRLFVRHLGELRSRELPGTESAFQPEFSPDGRWIAFSSSTGLKRVPVDGGPVESIAPMGASNVRGIAWSEAHGYVVGDVDGSIKVFPHGGGAPRKLFTPSGIGGTNGSRWPIVLADGETVVYAEVVAGTVASATLWMGSLKDGSATPLGISAVQPLGVIGGALVFAVPSGALMAVELDVGGRRVRGTPVTVVDQVSLDAGTASARAALSAGGTLVYQAGASSLELVLAGPGGARRLLPEVRAYAFPRLSPDGSRLAVQVSTGGKSDIWILDRTSGTLGRLTTGDAISNDRPEWSGDGRRVLFRSTRSRSSLWIVPADHSGPETELQGRSGVTINEGILSPDGKWLVYRVSGGGQVQDFWFRSMSGDTTARPLIVSPFYETAPRFSPDSRWLAFSSDESGTREVYVTPFPGPGPRHQVSANGGDSPIWSHDGRRLFYAHDRQLTVATLTLAPTFAVTDRKVAVEGGWVFNYVHANYDVLPGDREFVTIRSLADMRTVVVLDWATEVRAKLAAARATP